MRELESFKTLFFGLGAQKAATSWLHVQLSRHSAVHLPDRKEVHYWDTVRAPYHQKYRLVAKRALDRPSRVQGLRSKVAGAAGRTQGKEATAESERYARALSGSGETHDDYLDYLRCGAADESVLGEITPAYSLLNSRVYGEMFSLHPNVRFLFVMRDPVDRLVSGLKHQFRTQLDGSGASHATIARAFDDAVSDVYDPGVRRSDYATTIARLEQHVPASNVLYLFYETLFEESSMSAVAEFLGLDGLPFEQNETVYPGVAVDWEPDQSQRQAARAALQPTYDVVRQRFGTAVPDGWGDA